MWKVIVIAWFCLGTFGFYRRFIRNGYLQRELEKDGFHGPMCYRLALAIGLIISSVYGPFIIKRGEDEND